jgi:DNA ligase-1
MQFQALATLCEKLTTINKRTLMTEIVANFLRRLEEIELKPAVSMILGRVYTKRDHKTLDISWSSLNDIIMSITKPSWKECSEAFKKSGDIGSATQALFEQKKYIKQSTLFENPLSILEVQNLFESLANVRGYNSRERKKYLVKSLMSRSSPLEAKYLVKIMMNDMRTGFSEGLMESAISKSFSVPLKVVQKASLFTGDICELALLCKNHSYEDGTKKSFTIFRPIKVMLAQTAENISEALDIHGGKTAFEYKLDGARIQIHKSKKKVRIFSRRQLDVTKSLPEIFQLAQKEIKANEAILEGEVVPIGKNGRPLPFQYLMQRFRRKYNIKKMMEEIPVTLYLFEAIYISGKNFTNLQYVERRKSLNQAIGNIQLAKQLITRNPKKALSFLEESFNEGHEGLIAKKLDSPYTPGVRGRYWLKIKKTVELLDLVIIGADYGYGRRHKWLSNYYIAARDEKSGKFLMIGKTFKGLNDKEMAEMTKRLKKISLKEEGYTVTVLPKIVVEISCNEIQKSSKYKSGMSLRFARITRIREEKSPLESDSIQMIRQIYEKQFKKFQNKA